MPSIDTVRDWHNRVTIDREGDNVGRIQAIYLDIETDEPSWALVNTGLFGTKASFVPIQAARTDGEDVRVPYEKSLIRDAPRIDPDGELSEEEEAELYRHYGFDYGPSGEEDLAGAGQTGSPRDVDLVASGSGAERGRYPEEPTGLRAPGSAEPGLADFDQPRHAGATSVYRRDPPAQDRAEVQDREAAMPAGTAPLGPGAGPVLGDQPAPAGASSSLGDQPAPAGGDPALIEQPAPAGGGLPGGGPIDRGDLREAPVEEPGPGVAPRGRTRLRRYIVTEYVRTGPGGREEIVQEREPLPAEDESTLGDRPPGQAL